MLMNEFMMNRLSLSDARTKETGLTTDRSEHVRGI